MQTRTGLHKASGRDEPSVVAFRRAPYAPISALHGFLAAIRHVSPPARIDVAYLRKHALARGNEWAFISALKFLGVVDARGHPTPVFRRLQGSQQGSREALGNLIEAAYEPLFIDGGRDMTATDLRDWFAARSSPSQAANAARFLREACGLAGVTLACHESRIGFATESRSGGGKPAPPLRQTVSRPTVDAAASAPVAHLLGKLPAFQDWKGTPEEYVRVVEIFDRLAGRLQEGPS